MLCFIDTDQRHRRCHHCGEAFTVKYASISKRFCSRSCGVKSHATRPGQANSNWRGGATKHYLYDTYMDMIGRCERFTHRRYRDYGGRGISVCDRWRADFWAFFEDMGDRAPGRSLDRINNDGNYEPGNCRWATAVEQRHNRRDRR